MMRRVLLPGMLAISLSASALDLDKLKSRLDEFEQPAATSNASASIPPGLGQFTAQEQFDSLKQALTQGAETAVRNLAKENGYLGNDKVRIPLPRICRKQTAPCAGSAWENIRMN